MILDGFCHDETNNENCNYDGGDCCGYNINTDFCSDCKCYVNEACVGGTHPFVGDGFCNDETNNADCNYDGGDCCGVCVVKTKCTECPCLGAGNITYGESANCPYIIAKCPYIIAKCPYGKMSRWIKVNWENFLKKKRFIWKTIHMQINYRRGSS